MGGFREKIKSFGVVIQPTPNTYVPITQADLIPIYSPDDGKDPITAEDDTLTGSLWNAPRQFLGTRGRAGASARLRGPGNVAVPAAGAWPLGRLFMAAAFTEVRNAAPIIGAAQANANPNQIVLAPAASAVDDFYRGMVIQHAGLGAGVRANSVIRSYNGTTKVATLCESAAVAISAGNYTIPAQLAYVLSTGANVPNLSVAVGHDKTTNRYSDCALSSFAIRIPVSNDQSQDLPSIEFGSVGSPLAKQDVAALALPSGALTPVPPAKAGKFTFAGLKIGHATFGIDLGLEAGAPPNQNFDAGQEAYETLSGNRSINLDLNAQLVATLDLDSITNNQTPVNVMSIWGYGPGNTFAVASFNNYIDPLNETARNGFMGVSGNGAPSEIDKGMSIVLIF